MTLGLFARQAPIGLEVPEWATVFVAARGAAGDLEELVGGLATIGCRGATVVFRRGATTSEEPSRALRDWAEQDIGAADRSGASLRSTRPHFKLVACDEKFFASHRPEVEAGRAIYFAGSSRPGGSKAHLPDPPEELGGEEGCVVLDMLSTVVGQSRRPAAMLAAALAAEWEGPKPWRKPNWQGDEARAIRASATVAMALNWLCKPSVYRRDSFNFTVDFIDGITAKCFNERNLRARWQEPPARQPQAPPPGDSDPG